MGMPQLSKPAVIALSSARPCGHALPMMATVIAETMQKERR